MNRAILCDVDGVLANFVNGVIESHDMPLTHDEYATWDHHRVLGIADEKFWEPTREAGWWESLLPYSWSVNLIVELESIAPVVFTTTTSACSKCPSEKVNWLRDWGFLGTMATNYMIGPKKELMARPETILIDDSDDNVEKFIHAGGNAILFPQPWNKNRHLIKTDRVAYVLEAVHEWSETCS
jgi:5'(3')-deoxyribonucleotidase